MPTSIQKILTPDAPQPIGPYSQAVEAGNLVFCSGQIALDPVTGAVVGSDVGAQADQVMKNVLAVLKASGTSLDRVVKTTIFLKSMGDFPKVNEIYGRYVDQATQAGGVAPARSTVEVARLPKDVLVEIEVIAIK